MATKDFKSLASTNFATRAAEYGVSSGNLADLPEQDTPQNPPQSLLLDLIKVKFDLVQKKLMDHIIDENGCWIYQGHCEKGSHDKREHAVYGRTSFKYLGKSQKIYMHRLSYAFYKGVDPSEMMVCHSCDQTRCLNPDHLFLGTASDNMKDAAEKGRLSGQKGSENANSILTDEDVYLIISLLGKLNNKQIAAALGNKVTYATIGMIRKGNAWSHLTGIKRPAA